MEKDIFQKGEIAVKIKEGNISIEYMGLGGGVTATIKTDYFMDLLADAIPGEIDDAVIAMLKVALKG